MIFIATILAAAGAIVLSELPGRGKVVYTRMFALAGAYIVSCAIAGTVVLGAGGGRSDALAIPLTALPLMAAWLGFRIHLSNSVTLEMVTLLEQAGPLTTEQVISAYDPRGHADRRLQILRDAGYLIGRDDRLASTSKTRAVMLLMRFVCGRGGPRAVAAMLRRRGTS